MLKIKHLTKYFNGKKVLDDISLSIKKGEIAILLGASGVGKSTLLRILNNLDHADSAEVELDGKKLDLSTVNQTHTIGMVFQQFNLFDNLTVEHNITLPLVQTAGKTEPQAQAIAHDLLKKYQLFDKKNVYPSQLSGGQKQRLALARSLALKPEVVCLDEPTSALDPLLTTHVRNTIMQLADDGYIVLVATHDTTLLKKMPCTIYLMQNGKIIEQANSTNFFENVAAYPYLQAFIAGDVENSAH